MKYIYILFCLVILFGCLYTVDKFDETKQILILNKSGEVKKLSIDFADSDARDIKNYRLRHAEKMFVYPKKYIKIEISEFKNVKKPFPFVMKITQKTAMYVKIVIRAKEIELISSRSKSLW